MSKSFGFQPRRRRRKVSVELKGKTEKSAGGTTLSGSVSRPFGDPYSSCSSSSILSLRRLVE